MNVSYINSNPVKLIINDMKEKRKPRTMSANLTNNYGFCFISKTSEQVLEVVIILILIILII